MAIMERAATHFAGRDATKDWPDGLHVVICGSGSPVPDPERAGPCSLVIAGRHMFVVDAGENSSRNLGIMGIAVDRLDAVLITHFHSDHIDGLGSLMMAHWSAGSGVTPLSVVGPTGIETIVDGLNQAYALNNSYRAEHLGEELAPLQGAGGQAFVFKAPALSDPRSVTIWERNGIKISAFSVDHHSVEPAVGYRFDYKGRSVVFSGDTAPTPSLVRAAKGADLMVHEALEPHLLETLADAFDKKGLSRNAESIRKVPEYHSSPAQAADTAREAGVDELLLNHLGPPLPFRYFYSAFLGDASDRFSGPITIAEDGMVFSMRPNSRAIKRQNLR